MAKRQISTEDGIVFTPSANHVDFSSLTAGIPAVTIGGLLAVFDVTTGQTIYAAKGARGSGAGLGGTMSAGVLTFQLANTGMSSGDEIIAFYDDKQDASPVAVQAFQGGAPVSSSNRLPVDFGSGTISGTVTANLGTLNGAATAAKQDTGNTSLATIATNLALGQKTAAASLPMVLSSDGPFATNFGLVADTAATADTGSFSLIALVKRSLARWTSLLALLPASLGAKASAASFSVVLASDQAAIPVTGSFGSLSAVYNTTPPALTNGQTSPLQLSSSGQLLISGPGPSAATSGLTPSRVVAAASTNATLLKASAGNLGNVDLFNVAAYDVYLKFYNKASAPTVGTDTPVWTIPLKAGTGYSRSFPQGKFFSTGIAYAITKLQADTDTTVLVAGDVTGSIDWI